MGHPPGSNFSRTDCHRARLCDLKDLHLGTETNWFLQLIISCGERITGWCGRFMGRPGREKQERGKVWPGAVGWPSAGHPVHARTDVSELTGR